MAEPFIGLSLPIVMYHVKNSKHYAQSIEMTEATKILRLNLKREYWEDIRDGGKIYEFRRDTPYWRRRLRGVRYDEIHVCLGYPKRDDESRILKRKWQTAPAVVSMKHKEFGDDYVDVFCIDVREAV